ncbi:hypothetical protein K1T71_007716 [Dendrolimus kikuchii]|uniref:Uncharacterized protein n=1 Tax=Dendrolimus kikuchii TaxID=765133 RepID=A0ACC1CY68_9NEOP|nr:hypothetical protein K1T71_007716 [Dendrolimus kikuchii]
MNSVEEFNCIFCKEVFNNKEDLQTHFRKHGDPNFNQNHNKSRPQGEATSSKKTNEPEEVGCDVCSEVFPTISKAITHKHKMHPDHDTKYFCSWCGKLFTLKHLYTKHLQANHENAEKNEHVILHCDCCNVDFYGYAALLSHNKFFHRQDDLPMVGQSKKLKLCETIVLQICYCSFCGEEYDNKINLHKHIKDDHGDENQSPDDVLRCPLCDAIFFHLDAYEVHLTFHTVQDMYTEKNEMYNDETDFSLESIPPISEKVVSYMLPQEDPESAMNAVGIEKFLELAMDTESRETPKHKKHKKHKKSKKAAITLDEFLNMNKDVFGEDLDIQGVEEVPTQVISKRLKVKNPLKAKEKNNPELDKLRKQGIVIKKKPVQSNMTHSNESIKICPQAMKNITPSLQIKTQNDSLEKLINQNQDQLKIVRKPTRESYTKINDNDQMLSENVSEQSGENNSVIRTTSINNGVEAHQINDETINNKNTSEPLDENKSKTRSPTPDNDVNNQPLPEKSIYLLKNDDLNSGDSKLIFRQSKKPNIPMQSPNIYKTNIISDSQNIRNLHKGLTTDLINKQAKTENYINSPSTETNDKQLKDESSKKDPKETQKGSFNNSLSALKHLSHLLTIKPLNSPISSPNFQNIDTESQHDDSKKIHENDSDAGVSNMEQENEAILKNQNINTHKKANSIKNRGKNIVVKAVNQVHNNVNLDGECDEYRSSNEQAEKVEHNSVANKNVIISDNGTFVAKESAKISKQSTTSNTPKFNKIIKEETEVGNIKNFDENSKIPTNHDILKKLTNITAKPLKNTADQIVPASKSPQLQSKTKITKHINEHNVEVFNIEDSDSDEIDNSRNMPNEIAKSACKPKEVLKYLNKSMAVKPVQQQTTNKSFTKTITKSQTIHNEKQSYHSKESYNKMEYKQVQATKTVGQGPANEKNLALKNVLKGLGKNIIVKSRNSSPSHSIKSQDNDSQDSYTDAKGNESDIDSELGNVKITELDENVSEDEIKNNSYEHNVTAQSPNCSENSEPEDHNENFDDQDDIESQITANKLDKTMRNNEIKKSFPPKSTKTVNVKTVIDQKDDVEEESSTAIVPYIPKNLGSQISVKPVKQKMNTQNESMKIVRQGNASGNNQMTSSQKISNQTNTVNKAVTVKTFQTATETVIEEITTTVTKTIKTVKQEMRNTSQCSSNVMVTQQVQGIRPSQQIKNYQGTKVKHMPPTGLTIRNPTQVRPAIGPVRPVNQPVALSPVRPANQLVPIRPKNVARLSTPRMPAVKNNIPSTSNQGKPLKISPNALGALNAKRANIDDASGPFSCFKKPKESLIPVSDVSSFNSPGQNVQFSSSQVNKSNFVSTTKTVKGNSVVSQMKSEMCASSSQQLSKLSNRFGLKVVKTSQAKQTVVQEKCEVTAPKRTLEAIEKLQKSGLLVKKPRLDVNEESDHSQHEEDDPRYDSADEMDE